MHGVIFFAILFVAKVKTDAHLYKMAGNSVSVPVISAIGEQIKRVNEKYKITEMFE